MRPGRPNTARADIGKKYTVLPWVGQKRCIRDRRPNTSARDIAWMDVLAAVSPGLKVLERVGKVDVIDQPGLLREGRMVEAAGMASAD